MVLGLLLRRPKVVAVIRISRSVRQPYLVTYLLYLSTYIVEVIKFWIFLLAYVSLIFLICLFINKSWLILAIQHLLRFMNIHILNYVLNFNSNFFCNFAGQWQFSENLQISHPLLVETRSKTWTPFMSSYGWVCFLVIFYLGCLFKVWIRKEVTS